MVVQAANKTAGALNGSPAQVSTESRCGTAEASNADLSNQPVTLHYSVNTPGPAAIAATKADLNAAGIIQINEIVGAGFTHLFKNQFYILDHVTAPQFSRIRSIINQHYLAPMRLIPHAGTYAVDRNAGSDMIINFDD